MGRSRDLRHEIPHTSHALSQPGTCAQDDTHAVRAPHIPRLLTSLPRKEGIEISWEALGSRLIAIFCFPIEDSDVKLGVGDELLLKHPSRPDWVGKAKVASMDAFGTVEVILPGSR